jgi:O-antigen ligase
MRYVHNEYLQVAVQLGMVGAALLLGLLVAVGWLLLRATGPAGRRSPDAGLRAGVLAALAAFAVHSALDFTWHLPAIPLLIAALVGLATRPDPTPSSDPSLSADPAPSDAVQAPIPTWEESP